MMPTTMDLPVCPTIHLSVRRKLRIEEGYPGVSQPGGAWPGGPWPPGWARPERGAELGGGIMSLLPP